MRLKFTCTVALFVLSAGAAAQPVVEPEQLVEQMRGMSMRGQPGGGRLTPNEQKRREIINQMAQLGPSVLPPLSRALGDRDVTMRQNAALAMFWLAATYEHPQPKLNIRPAMPALIEAMRDEDSLARSWAAQALGEIGPDAKAAVPALIRLLEDPNDGSRNTSCVALGRIGPAAVAALPALRRALEDSAQNVRRSAQLAISRIEKN